MEPKQSNTPDFSTLTAIMKRFHEIPYEQFQKELHGYFDSNFPNPDVELSPAEQDAILKFKGEIMRLTDDLFQQGDIVQECKDLIKGSPKET